MIWRARSVSFRNNCPLNRPREGRSKARVTVQEIHTFAGFRVRLAGSEYPFHVRVGSVGAALFVAAGDRAVGSGDTDCRLPGAGGPRDGQLDFAKSSWPS